MFSVSFSNRDLEEDESKGLLLDILSLSPWKQDPAIESRKQVWWYEDCQNIQSWAPTKNEEWVYVF